MKTIEYARMAEREQTYWWHVGRLRIIQSYIQAIKGKKRDYKILNVGCGTGGTVDMLQQLGVTQNVDISDEAIRFMNKRGYHNITKVDDIELPFEDESFDLVGAFDVLEHISKDVAALQEWKRVIKPDGAILVTVPAYQWLWSGHDVSLYHKRRYTTRLLRERAKAAGLKVDKISYAIVFSLPLIVGFRLLNKALRRTTDSESSYVDLPDPINKLFTRALYLEARMHRMLPFPAGTSVVAVLRKPPKRAS